MKNLKYIILFISSIGSLFSQSLSDVLQEEIDNKIKLNFGNQYYLDDMVIIDSILNSRFNYDYNFQDPYGTLEHSVLFTSSENNAGNAMGFVGVFKAGEIIWASNINIPLKNVLSLKCYGSMELNNNGQIELLFTANYSGYQSQMDLWVFSWDGNFGERINAVNNENQSILISSSSAGFEFPDINGDGILEIQGYEIFRISNSFEDSLELPLFDYKEINYCWNGSLYGKWNNCLETDSMYIYPRNKLNSEIRIGVKANNNIVTYTYKLLNTNTSIQAINEFVLGYNNEDVYNLNSEGWFFSKNGIYSSWVTNNPKNFIYPGYRKEFSLVGPATPQIVECFLLGNNKVNYNISPLTELSINSIKKFTIGPKLISFNIVPLDFIDTLIAINIRSNNLSWILDSTTWYKYDSLFTLAKTQLQQNNNNAARATLQTVLQQVDIDSTGNLTSEAYALIRYNTEYLLDKIPSTPANPNLVVKLNNSLGNQIPASNVQYYEGSWKDAVNNGDGTFTVITTRPTVSIRVYYEYASMQANNVVAQNNTYTFQTVKCTVQLKNSLGNLIDTGTVQYYAGAWRSFGTTVNGVATKELLPINYSFRMTYEYASIDKQQNLSTDPTVVFQTVNAAVQLKNSQGNLIDQGTVQYYAGAWRSFGTTVNGVATKELLPINYSFRMTYEYASIDKQQNLSVDPTVVFQTVNAAVQLKNSSGNLIDTGTVQYYAGAWRSFGTTSNGVAYKELLPINYSFRMIYEYASIDKQQNLSTDPTVVFQTVNAAVQLKNSLGNLIDTGTVQYYAGAWRTFGTTVNGVATKELLPINYSFRMTYEYASIDKQQNLSVDPTVVFQTVNAAVQLKNSLGNLIDTGTVQYYAGAWRSFGTTVNGVATKELLPINYSFRMTYEYASIDKQQNLSTDPTVVFQTVNAAVQLKNSSGNLIDTGTVQYYAGAWRSFGTTSNGVAYKELLPINYSFRMTYEYVSKDKQQNLSTNPVVDFNTVLCTVKVSKTSNNQPINNAVVKYYAGAWRNLGTTNADGIATKELLPANISFRATYGNVSLDKQQDISVNNLVEILLNVP